MAHNEENLIPFNELTEEEQRKLASKGGKASVEARRKKKAMQAQAELLLSLPIKNENMKLVMQQLGIEEDEQTNQMAVLISMLNTALDKKSKARVQAATFLRDTSGNKPAEKVEVSKSTDEVIEELENYINEKK